MIIRLLIVANNLAGGGAEKVLLMLLDELQPPEYIVDLLLIKNKGVYMDALPSHVNTTTMIDISCGDRSLPREPSTLTAYCRQNLSNDYDVEIAFLEGPPTKLLAYHAGTRARKIAWVHTDLQNVHWTCPYYSSDREERDAYELFDHVVFVSEGALQGFQQRFGECSVPCSVISNPTDMAAVRAKASLHCVSRYPFCFCTVASLCARKGHSRLLYAMGRLFQEGRRFHLNLLGDGEQLPFLKGLVDMLGLRDHVHFCGFQLNPYPYMAHCDAVISSSLSEGFPLALCEALCLERPVIATRCSGNQDVLQNGRFGLLVDNTEEGLYLGMRKVLEDEDFLAELKARARLGGQSLQYDRVMDKIHALLHESRGDKQ